MTSTVRPWFGRFRRPGRWRRLLRVVSLCWLAAFAVVLAAAYPVGRTYAANHIFSVANKKPFALTAAQGDWIEIRVQLASSVDGHWATSGFMLTIRGRATVPVLAERRADWGETIKAHPGAVPFTVSVAFTVPAPDAGQRTVSGDIAGTVRYPTPRGFAGFIEDSDFVDIPMQITVTPAGSTMGLSIAVEFLGWLALALVVVLLAGALGVLVIAGRARGQAMDRSSATGVFLALVAGALFGGLLAVLISIPLRMGLGGLPGVAGYAWYAAIGMGVAFLIGCVSLALHS